MIISSIGIGIGLAVTELTSAASETTAVLQGLAAGTLIYVVMFEVIPLWRRLKGPRTIVFTKSQRWNFIACAPGLSGSRVLVLSLERRVSE